MTDSNKKSLIYAFLTLLALLIGSVVLNIIQYHDLHNMEEKTVVVEKHDTLTIRDTILTEKPSPIEVKVTKEYIKVPVEVVKNDTVFVELSKTEKVYKDDSTYECQVSGIEPNLDYIKIFPKTTIINNEKLVTTTKKVKPRFNFGLQIGTGYGFINRKPDVYIGIGGQYNF